MILTERKIITLDFVPELESPVLLFDSLSKMYNSIIKLDTEVIKKVDPLIEIQFFLVDIKYSSIYTEYLKKIIIPEKDDNLVYSELSGNVMDYSNQSQAKIIDTLIEAEGSAIDNSQINKMHNEIVEYSSISGVDKNPHYKPPNKLIIENAIDSLSESTKMLNVADKFYFEFNNERKEIKKVYTNIDYEEIKREMAKKITETTIHLILKIKTADFLGKSKWKFKLDDNRTIEAKILDEDWLARFHSQIENIGSGDSIEIYGIFIEMFDEYGNCIDSQYNINKVIGVHKSYEQNELEF